jgi:hypothetical protein
MKCAYGAFAIKGAASIDEGNKSSHLVPEDRIVRLLTV